MRVLPIVRSLLIVVILLAAHSALRAQQPGDPAAPAIRVGVNLVRVPARVVGESGGPIRNLQTKDFRVFENGAEQKVAVFGEDRDPVYVALVVDTSASTSNHIAFLVEAAEKFAARFSAEDHLAVYEAGPDAVRVQNFTRDRGALGKAMRALATAKGFESLTAKRIAGSAVLKRNTGRGGTLLYDAMVMARADFPAAAERRIVIVFTDGWDSGSDTDFPGLQSSFLCGSEQLFTVIVKTPETAVSAPLLMQPAAQQDRQQRVAKDWSVIFDFSARHQQAEGYERIARAFLGELPAEGRVSLYTFDSRFLPLLAPRAEPKAKLVERPLDAAEALSVLPQMRRTRGEREKAGARNRRVAGENILIVTAGDWADPRGLLRRLPPGSRPVLINADDLKSEHAAQQRMQTLLHDPQGKRRVLLESALAHSERMKLQLPQLALDTGGNAFAVDRGEDLDATYQNIAYQIRSSYALGYYTGPHSGRREIQVTVADPALRVHARRVVFVN